MDSYRKKENTLLKKLFSYIILGIFYIVYIVFNLHFQGS